jgi:hypothetical protein
MWPVQGKPISGAWLDMEPVRVLYEFDGPRIFTCKDAVGNRYLAYQCGEAKGVLRFLVVPCSDDLERALTAGAINLRDALARPRAWLFDLSYQWQIRSAWQTDVDSLPPFLLPRPGVMLWRHLTPVINPLAPRPATSQHQIVSSAFAGTGGRHILAGAGT